jgi:Cupin domain
MVSEPDDASTWPSAMIPPDDPKRQFTIADPDGPRARHVSVSGGTYTILVTGGDSAGRYCLIDMLVPPGSGPPPHRHDFEEMFTLLEGELEFTLRTLARQLTSLQMRRTSTRISPVAQRECFACAHRRDRKNFSWLLVIRLMLAPRRHPTSPSRSGSSEGGRLESSGPNTGRNT